MGKRKRRRSRCVNEACGKQFRHSNPSAKTCSDTCRQRVSRTRRKAREDADREERWKRIRANALAQLREREAERLAVQAVGQARRAAAIAEQKEPEPTPRPRKRKRKVGGLGPLYDPPPVTIVIRTPRQAPMTPLNKR